MPTGERRQSTMLSSALDPMLLTYFDNLGFEVLSNILRCSAAPWRKFSQSMSLMSILWTLSAVVLIKQDA